MPVPCAKVAVRDIARLAPGLVVAGLLSWMLANAVPNVHQPKDGIVGTPAFRNYSESRERTLYVAAHLLAVGCCAASYAFLIRYGGRFADEPASETRDAVDTPCFPIRSTADRRRRLFTGTLCLGIYAGFAWVAGFDAPFDIFHEGARLNYAQAALDGKVPYRDFDCVYGLWYGVGQHLAAFRLSGEVSVHAAHRLGRWMAPLLPVAMFWVCWVATRRQLEALAGLGLATLLMFAPPFLKNWPVDHHGFTTRHAWPAILVALTLIFLENRRPFLIFLAGVGVGLAALWPLQSALVPLVAIAGTLALLPVTEGHGRRAAVRASAWFLAGLAVGLLPLLVYLMWHEALAAFVSYHAKVLRIHASWNGEMFPGPSELARRHNWHTPEHAFLPWTTFAYFAVPPALTVLGGALLGRPLARLRLTVDDSKLLCLTLAAFTFFFSAVERSDGHHAGYAAMMHVPLLLFLLRTALPMQLGHGREGLSADLSTTLRDRPALARARLRAALARAASPAFLALVIVPSLYLVAARVRSYAQRDRQAASPLSELPRLRGIPQWPGEPPRVQWLDLMGKYVAETTHTGDTILDLSDWFSAHFLYDRPSASRFYYSYDAVSPADQQQIVARLERTDVVIVPLDQEVVDGIPTAARYHLVMERVLVDFEPDYFPYWTDPGRGSRVYSGYVVMRRRDAGRQEADSGRRPRGTDMWLRSAPQRMNLGFLPYFGRELFAADARSGTSVGPAAPDSPGSAGDAPQRTPVVAEGAGRRIYELLPPPDGASNRLLWLEVQWFGGGQEKGLLGWTLPEDRAQRGWALEFSLGSAPQAHTYVIKLASVPQWVWSPIKSRILVDLPATATLTRAWWQ